MGSLIYSVIASLDGYVADVDGCFDWAEPDAEVHAFVNDLERSVGTYLYGRRMYEVMQVWETADGSAFQSPETQDYARIWRAAEKVVYSSSLAQASTTRTRIEPVFDPEQVRSLTASSERDVSIGGPALASAALAAGLVDECHLLLHPIIVGGGNPALPDDLRLSMELLDVGRFDSGVVHLHYRTRA